MSHFSIRYFNNLAGAGGPKKPDPPPPPTLKPPKMGDLQAISSYEYTESIDLISDGVIEGLVNQRGEYVDDVSIFEGIYLEEAPIRQSTNFSGDAVYTGYLDFVGTKISGEFYSNNEFVEKSISSVASNLTETVSGITFSILNSKLDIAESIYNDIKNIKNELASTSSDSDSSQNANYQQFVTLNSKFNYNSIKEVQAYLLADIPEKLSSEYPFFCIKLSFDSEAIASYNIDFSFTYDTVVTVDSDIFNQIYIPLEATELQNTRFLNAPRKLNLTYINPEKNGDDQISALSGSIYIFLYKENDVPLKNSIDAVIKYLKYIKIFNPSSKYNVGNASMEIRNGEELQKPLSLFSKTYSDKTYGISLRGPFAKGRSVKTLYSKTEPNKLETIFDANAASTTSGVDPTIKNIDISQEELTRVKDNNPGLYLTTPSSFYKKVLSFEKAILNKGTYFKFLSANRAGDIITFTYVYLYTFKYNSLKSWSGGKISFSLDVSTGKFSSEINANLRNAYRHFPAATFSGNKQFIKTTSPGNGFIIDQNSFAGDGSYIWWGGGSTSFGPSAPPAPVSYALITALYRATIKYSSRQEGSDDTRLVAGTTEDSYSDWNKDYIASATEPAVATTHIVSNPNVDRVYLTMAVRVLRDQAHRETYLKEYDGKNKKVDAGTTIPSVIQFKIELGYQEKNGDETITESREYQIKGTVDTPVTIDIGREENNTSEIIPKYSRFIMGAEKSVGSPLILPEASEERIRFVRVYRTTFESYSSLIKREISLEKVSEVVNLPFSYPYSTICGLKLDARSLPQIPARSYDARFKKVFVPSNYFPLLPNGKDKRYLTAAEFTAATTEQKTVYQGNWDGTFKLAWTDNPAWVLFDLLINRRYGLGNFISPEQVNYWELYKIGRYCDAVDGDGVFTGVPSANGGKEPRYGFNGAIADKTNVFDMIQSIIASFRGNMFYSNSEINFTNDRLKPIMSFFNNSNVKDGMFTYTNSRKDLQYNVVEVSYLDRDDLFKEKIEYVEDPDDIKVRGILRTSAQTFGVTSRAHAQRIGQHTIYSTINEDQNIQFSAGLESLLCRPGDLISVNDELRTLKRHVGRILEVDLANYTIRTNIDLTAESFSPSGLTGQISILIPTGKLQSDDFYNLAKSPSKLSIADVYQTDIPQSVNLTATGYDFSSYGVKMLLDTGISNSGLPLLDQVKIGTPCSITLANTAQEIYKIQSIKELNLNEYEIIASKFDTGKFAEIEAGENLNEFFNYFPSVRDTFVNEGTAAKVSNQFAYDLTGFPLITAFTTGNFDSQNDIVDITGQWNSVEGANAYNVELISPKYKSTKVQTTGTSIMFEDQAEVGNYTLKVTAVGTGVYPNLISATHSKTFKVLSYIAPKRSNGIVKSFAINSL
ncbi:MAG: phage tail protein [Sediminibacterium sp.]